MWTCWVLRSGSQVAARFSKFLVAMMFEAFAGSICCMNAPQCDATLGTARFRKDCTLEKRQCTVCRAEKRASEVEIRR